MNNAKHEMELHREPKGSIDAQTERSVSFGRTALWVLICGAYYYLSTQNVWALCFPDSKVSLFFPPHAILVSVLLLIITGTCGHSCSPPPAFISWPRSRSAGHFLLINKHRN